MTNRIRFSTVTIYWQEGDDFCSQTCRNSTIAEAMARAAQWGCPQPAWWKFWAAKPRIETYL